MFIAAGGIGKDALATKNIRISQNFVDTLFKDSHPDFLFPVLFPQQPIFEPGIIKLFENYFDLSRKNSATWQEIFATGWHFFNALAELPVNVEEKNLDEKNELYKSIEMMDKLVYTKKY